MTEPIEVASPSPAAPRRGWGLSLRTLLLVVAAVAVWMAWSIQRGQNETLRRRVGPMRTLARELFVEDPSKIAIIRGSDEWYEVPRWDLYLPERPGGFVLKVSVKEVAGGNYPAHAISAPLSPGRHRLRLTMDAPWNTGSLRARVYDGETLLLEADEPDAGRKSSSATSSTPFETLQQMPADKPVLIYRRQYSIPDPANPNVSRSPTGEGAGVVLWIEPAN